MGVVYMSINVFTYILLSCPLNGKNVAGHEVHWLRLDYFLSFHGSMDIQYSESSFQEMLLLNGHSQNTLNVVLQFP